MTPLIRKHSDSSVVQGELIDPASAADLDEPESLWKPVLRNVATEAFAKGESSGIKVWQGSWGCKAVLFSDPGVSVQGIRAGGKVQGLIKLFLTGRASRLVAGSGLVYVDFVEAAPWNNARYMGVLGRDPVYKDVGVELVRLAIAESVVRSLEGRVGLHSVPGAVDFYGRIGMQNLGADPGKGNMPYFEFTSDKAKELLGDRT